MSTTRIRESLAVECPVDELQGAVDAFLTAKRAFGSVRRRLRVSLDAMPLLGGLPLTHNVLIVAYHDRDDQNLNDLIRIAWRPEGGGPFPKFSGTLVTWARDGSRGSMIEIEGTYAPPLGIAGAAFDEAVGHLIAQRTAATLLADIAATICSPAVRPEKARDAAL